MAETADEDLARVIELLKCGDVNKLILEFGSHNTIGSLLYFMTSMAQTLQGLADFSSFFRALVRSAVGLRRGARAARPGRAAAKDHRRH